MPAGKPVSHNAGELVGGLEVSLQNILGSVYMELVHYAEHTV